MGRPRQGWKLRDPRPPSEPFYTVRFTNKAGRRTEVSTGTRDAREAARIAAELYARDLASLAIATPDQRVNPLLALDELFALWLADLEATHDARTVATYTSYARVFVAHFGSFARITRATMADYQRARLTKVLKDTLEKERSAMNGFLVWCEEQGVVAEADVPTWPKIPKKALGVRSGPQRAAPVDVTREEVNAFLLELPIWSRARRGRAHAVRPRFIVAYETALRPATLDLLSIPEHWSPGESVLRITDAIDKARYGRTVPISALAKAALEYVAEVGGITSGLIFGKHDYRERVKAARIAAGLPKDFAVYDLRHGRIGHLVDEPGTEIRAVMFLVGHLLMTTTNRYVRGQAAGARQLLESSEYRGDNGEERTAMLSAKEGNRTPTPVKAPEPESGGIDLEPSNYGSLLGQGGALKGALGPSNGELPETQIPDSVSAAARYLAVLRLSDASLERALYAMEQEP